MIVFLWIVEVVLAFTLLGVLGNILSNNPHREKDILASTVVFVMMLCVLMFINKLKYGGF